MRCTRRPTASTPSPSRGAAGFRPSALLRIAASRPHVASGYTPARAARAPSGWPNPGGAATRHSLSPCTDAGAATRDSRRPCTIAGATASLSLHLAHSWRRGLHGVRPGPAQGAVRRASPSTRPDTPLFVILRARQRPKHPTALAGGRGQPLAGGALIYNFSGNHDHDGQAWHPGRSVRG